MGLLIIGSIVLDNIETPFSKIENALGGSCTYVSLSASYFSGSVNLVGVVGDDFPKEYMDMLENHNIQLDGLQIIKGGKTFRYGCKYRYDLNVRDTLFTDLNVFENFRPDIPERWKKDSYVILGNIAPTLQLHVLNQLENPKFVVCDTMNFWIEGMKNDLFKGSTIMPTFDFAVLPPLTMTEILPSTSV